MTISLQEMITRGRFLFSGAPKRYEVFKMARTGRTAKEIAKKVGRSQNAVLNDLARLRDLGLTQAKEDGDGNVLKRGGSTVYEQSPVARSIPASYFREVADTKSLVKQKPSQPKKASDHPGIHVPNEAETLDICRDGETQLYEFKAPGVRFDKMAKEIAGFLHTKRGGILLYGVEDDGSVIGSDLSLQDFDQRLQNSIRNSIQPSPTVEIRNASPMGSLVILVIVPPWDRSTLYQFKDGRYYIRKGTNVFSLKPEEMKKINSGKWII